MTNAEKFLKDGVSEYDFVDFVFNEGNIRLDAKEDCTYIGALDLLHLLQQQADPILTEDGRVILRNMIIGVEIETIGRDMQGNLFVLNKDNSIEYITVYNHLFHFIRPRRKILNRRIIGREK